MRQHVSDPCARLLQEWQVRRDAVESYHRAIGFLTPSSREASQGPRAELGQLNDKLSHALRDLLRTSDQLRICEQEHAAVR
jgi:hypothetical protein